MKEQVKAKAKGKTPGIAKAKVVDKIKKKKMSAGKKAY